MNDLIVILLERLARSSLQSIVLAGVVWSVLRLMNVGPAMRARLWWLVSAQMVLGLVLGPIELPWLPAVTEAASLAPVTIAYTASSTWQVSPTIPAPHPMTWRALVSAAWGLVVLVTLLLDVVGWWATRRLVKASEPINDTALLLRAGHIADALQLRRPPRLRTGAGVTSPHVAGFWRPMILLPPPGSLGEADLAMAIAHEMAHVRRGDLWLGMLPTLARRLFFFNPAVFIAAREYALAREAACDRLVVDDARMAPDRYGRLLLTLGVGRSLQGALGSASPTFTMLKRRLVMLQQPNEKPRQRALAWIVVVMVAATGTLPYRVTAAPSTAIAANAAVDAAPASTAARVPPAPPVPPPPPPILPPAPPAPPPPPPPPAPPKGDHQTSISIHDSQAGLAYALYDHDTRIVDGDVDVAGSSGGEPTLWVRDGSRRYVIHDKATIDRVQAAFKPQLALSGRQRELGAKQAALGGQQAALGREQAELGMRQANAAMAGSQATSPVRQASSEARHAEIARLQTDIAARQRPIADQQRQLGEQQAELGRQQRAMSTGVREQAQRAIVEAIRTGIAKPVAAN